MATWAASGERARVRRIVRDGRIVLAAAGLRFLVRPDPRGGLLLTTPGGRLAGACADLAECEARVRDLAARRGG